MQPIKYATAPPREPDRTIEPDTAASAFTDPSQDPNLATNNDEVRSYCHWPTGHGLANQDLSDSIGSTFDRQGCKSESLFWLSAEIARGRGQ